jgi:hypothetical protein
MFSRPYSINEMSYNNNNNLKLSSKHIIVIKMVCIFLVLNNAFVKVKPFNDKIKFLTIFLSITKKKKLYVHI